MKKSTKFLLAVLALMAYALAMWFCMQVAKNTGAMAERAAATESRLASYKGAVNRGIAMRRALTVLYEQSALFLWPMCDGDFKRNTSPIGIRKSPIYGGEYRQHRALDMAGVWKARIIAIGNGYISDVYPAPDGYWRGHETKGGYIEMTHADGWVSRYSHLSETYYIVIGEPVKSGAVIGRQGNTGLSIDDHLHFELLLDGEYVNPLLYCESPK